MNTYSHNIRRKSKSKLVEFKDGIQVAHQLLDHLTLVLTILLRGHRHVLVDRDPLDSLLHLQVLVGHVGRGDACTLCDKPELV